MPESCCRRCVELRFAIKLVTAYCSNPHYWQMEKMGQTFRYYTALRPLRDNYVDDGSLVLVFVPVHDNGLNVEVAVIGTRDDVQMIRVSVSGVKEEPSATERKWFDDLIDSMLALLRIFHDPEISFAEPAFRYSNILEDGLPPELNIGVKRGALSCNLDVNFATAFMHSDKELRDVLRLYADALHPYLPMQYRYLSAFKVIEHEFKLSRRKWRPELDVVLSHFQIEYEELQISKMSLKAFMIDLRDKCAHIKVGDADRLTIVGISSPDTLLVIRFLPLILKIVQKHVFDAYKSDGTSFRAV